MSDFVAEPVSNEFGQVINPGDSIVYVRTAWKSTSIQCGVYAGVYKGNEYKYNRDTKTYDTVYGVKAVKITGVPTHKYEEVNGRYEAVPSERCAVLPLKRVYRLDTTMLEMTGKRL